MKLRTTNDDLTTNDLTKATNYDYNETTNNERRLDNERLNKSYEQRTTNDDYDRTT